MTVFQYYDQPTIFRYRSFHDESEKEGFDWQNVDNTWKLLLNGEIFFPLAENLDDPNELRIPIKLPPNMDESSPIVQAFSDAVVLQRKQIGIACFSSRNDIPMMWSKYAAGGNGICVEFNLTKTARYGCGLYLEDYCKAVQPLPLYKVDYGKRMHFNPLERHSSEDYLKLVMQFFLWKDKSFEHENEYRSILIPGGKVFHLSPGAIKAIYVSTKTSLLQLARLYSAIKNGAFCSTATLYRTISFLDSYKFEKIDIDELDKKIQEIIDERS